MMEAEIAELESFIDSYVGDDPSEPISSEVFTNTGAKLQEFSPNGYDHNYDDFQEELLEYQKLQESTKSDDPSSSYEQWIVKELGSTDIVPDGAIPLSSWDPVAGFQGGQQNFHPPPQGVGLPPPTFPPYYPPHPEYSDPGNSSPAVPPVTSASQSPSDRKGSKLENYSPNDLRHRLSNKSGRSIQNGNHNKQEDKHQRPGRAARKLSGQKERKGSDDSNWRRSDSNPIQRRDSDRRSIDARSDTSSGSSKGERRNSNKTPPKHDHRKKPHSRQSSQSSASETAAPSGSKVLSGRSKAEVRSWLKQEPKNSTISIERQMKKLEVAQTKDVPRIIKSAQAFITSEKKLQEVAEMICTKAMRNPQFAENGAILCNEMSKRMINGTSFRTVTLNIVQGHYKNRRHIITATIRNPEEDTWSGFVAFLVELFLHLRTSSNERLKALINPVFDCFFEMLNEKSANATITKCFASNIKKVGAVLEAVNAQKMAQLIALLRDHCILPSDLSTEARRHLLQSLESYARGWKGHTLDNSYHFNCSNKSLAH